MLKRISLKGFRNLDPLELEFSQGLNLIVGENGQGKTNLLEAIWLLTGEKSFRQGKNSQLIGFEQSEAKSKGLVNGGRGESLVSFVVSNERFKLFKNHLPVQSSEGSGFAAVVFSPDHLSIVKDGPLMRREFLDVGIGQLKSRYRGVLGEYQRILKQRNALLKMNLSDEGLETQLDVLDSQLCRVGMIIKRTRESYLKRLTPKAQEYFKGICGEMHTLDLAYDSQLPIETEEYLAVLKESHHRDIAAGTTLIGVHRDDMTVLIDDKPARIYGSQGQQRCCVLALKLAEAFLFGEFLGETPVVLLDDVLSELDEHRRRFLLEQLNGPQIFMTACDPLEEFLGRPLQLFEIKKGTVLPSAMEMQEG